MSATQNNKRRRTDDTITHISDLPVGILVDVSTYLSKPSRAMLAVAFTAPTTSWKNNDLMHRLSPISKAIVSSSEWDILDFMDIEKSLANRLLDDDISAVLQCINAHDVLKKLKLTGCIKITGQGLSPLRESVVLEQIDLSLLKKYEDPMSARLQHVLSKEVVLPILDSIISTMGCSLKYILFPYSWKEDEEDGPLHEFANRYDHYQENCGVRCSECAKRIRGHRWFKAKQMYHYNTCYDCLEHYCDECEGDTLLNFCNVCKKDYCRDCDGTLQQRDTCFGCRTRYGEDSDDDSSESRDWLWADYEANAAGIPLPDM